MRGHDLSGPGVRTLRVRARVAGACVTILFSCFLFVVVSTSAYAAESGPVRSSLPGAAADVRVVHDDGLEINLPEDPDRYGELKQRGSLGSDVPATRRQSADASPSPDVPLSHNFAGMNRTQGLADPPDTILGASPNTVLEAVNRAVRLTNTSGAQLDLKTLNDFYTVDSPTADNTFDPKVYFDSNSVRPRYYVVALQYGGRDTPADGTDDESRTMLAVSRSSDPTDLGSSNWCQYFWSTLRSNTWADYPGVGVGADAFAVSTNQFGFSPTTFQFSTISYLLKNQLNNNAGSCPSAGGLSFGQTDAAAFTLQPAQQYTNPSSFVNVTNPLYFVSSNSGGGTTYSVWRLANVATTPTFTGLGTLTAPTYSTPPQAPGGAAGTQKIDTGDARVLQVASRGDVLHAVHTTGCQFTAFTSTESCFRYAKFAVTESSASLSETQTIGNGDNTFVHHPGVAVDKTNRVAIPAQTHFPANSWWLGGSVFTRKEGQNWELTELAAGSCALNTGYDSVSRLAYRSGDYVGAQTSADGSHFWVAVESAETFSGTCTWGTTIANPK